MTFYETYLSRALGMLPREAAGDAAMQLRHLPKPNALKEELAQRLQPMRT